MGSASERSRLLERFERLSLARLDSDSLRREAVSELQRVIGFDRWCWPLADPATVIPCSGIALHDYGPGVPRTLELEYSEDTFASKPVLARRKEPAGSLSGDTGGDLARSARWDQVMRHVGIGDVAAVACRDRFGAWGWFEAYRDRSDRAFQPGDLELLAAVGPGLGAALRRGSVDPPNNPSQAFPSSPGTIILDADLKPTSWTANAPEWIGALPSAHLYQQFGILPTAIYPAAALARSDGSENVHVLLRADNGNWAAIQASRLEGDGVGSIAVGIRQATAGETFDQLCRGYGLTRREREVTCQVLMGRDTDTIREHLFISAHTVQDHLKSVFAKIGIKSRRELRTRFASLDPADSRVGETF